MNDWQGLDDLLRTDPLDPGCDAALDMMDVYLELFLADAAPERRYPGVAVHLRGCPACEEDFRGLLAAVTGG
ncbi:hypothetical protein OG937_06360 [Streptomyces sp. NBC_00510]